jgi:hypothetical protein
MRIRIVTEGASTPARKKIARDKKLRRASCY